jgi:anthranilate phosphoribosyltransferase
MPIAQYIKEIGRGKDGARSLGRDEAEDLFAQVLDRRASDMEIGGFALAMRIKGETPQELAGFMDAAHARCLAIPASRPTVLLPSYNGARRLPNLTPLLALLLAQQGVAVLVHGPLAEPGRVASAEIFRDLGLPPAGSAADVERAWARREPAFVPIAVLCPPLAVLLEARRVLGLRNSGHTVAKLLAPCRGAAPALRVVNHTHPEYATLLASYLALAQADALLLRGTAGEPSADPRRTPRMDVFVAGVARPELSQPAQEGVLAGLPVLPRSCDAATTAVYIQGVLSGEKPAPEPLARQVECIVHALAAAAEAARQDGDRATWKSSTEHMAERSTDYPAERSAERPAERSA